MQNIKFVTYFKEKMIIILNCFLRGSCGTHALCPSKVIIFYALFISFFLKKYKKILFS